MRADKLSRVWHCPQPNRKKKSPSPPASRPTNRWARQMQASADYPWFLSDAAAGMLQWRPPARFDRAASPPRRSRLPARSRPAPTLTRTLRSGARPDCRVSCQPPMTARHWRWGGAGCDAGGSCPVSPRKRAAILAR